MASAWGYSRRSRINTPMSDTNYTIYLSNGNPLGTVDDVSITNTIADTSKVSLNLLRRGARGYAEAASENFVHLLENFASASAPSNALTGQLWFDASAGKLKVNNGTGFSLVSDGIASHLATPVTIATSGDVIGSASFDGSTGITIPTTLRNSGVVAGTFTVPTNMVVDAQGRITSVTQGTSVSTAGLAVDANVVHKAGDTMTGTLTVNADINASTGYILQGGNQLVPRGVITMFFGTTAPAGWSFCDGSNGTPDLRDRFVVGSGLSYTLGTTGGYATNVGVAVNNLNHTHTFTTAAGLGSISGSTDPHVLSLGEIPSHTHIQLYGIGRNNLGDSGTIPSSTPSYPASSTYASSAQRGIRYSGTGSPGLGNDSYSIAAAGGGGGHSHTFNGLNLSHSHTGTTDNPAYPATPSVSFDNRPPFYAISYIMKL